MSDAMQTDEAWKRGIARGRVKVRSEVLAEVEERLMHTQGIGDLASTLGLIKLAEVHAERMEQAMKGVSG